MRWERGAGGEGVKAAVELQEHSCALGGGFAAIRGCQAYRKAGVGTCRAPREVCVPERGKVLCGRV